jgi:hypothetical protein
MAQEYWIVRDRYSPVRTYGGIYLSRGEAERAFFDAPIPKWPHEKADWVVVQLAEVVEAPADKPAEPAPAELAARIEDLAKQFSGLRGYVHDEMLAVYRAIAGEKKTANDAALGLNRDMTAMRDAFDSLARAQENMRRDVTELEAAHEVDGKLLERIEKLEGEAKSLGNLHVLGGQAVMEQAQAYERLDTRIKRLERIEAWRDIDRVLANVPGYVPQADSKPKEQKPE